MHVSHMFDFKYANTSQPPIQHCVHMSTHKYFTHTRRMDILQKEFYIVAILYASAYVTYGKIYNKYYYDCLKRLTRIYSMSVKIVFCFFPPNISSTYIYCEFSKIRSSEALGLTSCAYGAVNSSLKTTDVPKNRLIPKFQLMGFPLNEPVSHRTFSMS